ncbi:hypothetical protein FISHEDRAFT_47269 [Fistulina hepatica ATCC 64428]|uniref:CxC1-like cysteine cluster associated with KDZ transposases domain-containing protein n=1 Tax=Fistulina hepatica ATCC 64428 TaxID=1128425 RepID=A0A0D7A950_9AGAR|nr:hypothetical protein FISHEDRAFT_47269 [Fistulina hepatica ATCC 64428]
MPELVEAYLGWKYPSRPAPSTATTSNTAPEPSVATEPPPASATESDSAAAPVLPLESETGGAVHRDTPPASSPSVASTPQPDEAPASEQYDFQIDVIDVYTLQTTMHVPRKADVRTVPAIAQLGYLAVSPINPSTCFAFNTLELYRIVRMRKPSFSVEAFAKVICDLYNVAYWRSYRIMLSDAFDIYLRILRYIDKRVQGALGRDQPNYRVQNACTACCYKLEDEPPLVINRMLVMDGNNSLKRIAGLRERTRGDCSAFDSDYFISEEFVNSFAHEVQSHRHDSHPSAPEQSTDLRTTDEDEDDKEDGAQPLLNALNETVAPTPCADNWKAAMASEVKRMWGIYRETGVFATACRHGFILWLADMVQSGELAKYPLAMTAKILDVLGDSNILAYDIGCAFEGTLSRSSLAPKVEEKKLRCCVNAFHGTAHNAACQTKYHPDVIEGMGLEDLETCERVFSSSNQVARPTRYATAFHRHQFIDLHFRQWDEDKYMNLGKMLYDNYRQALSIIDTESDAVSEAAKALNVNPDDFEHWEKEQAAYFSSSIEEPEEIVLAMAYVELLQQLRDVDASYNQRSATFINIVPVEFGGADSGRQQYNNDASRTRRAETQRKVAGERRDRILREVVEMEVRMGIPKRWTIDDKEYTDALQYLEERKYRRCLDNLLRLVVQRLFELQRMNLSQLGNFVLALQSRCKAIRRAVTALNTAAKNLTPPRKPLDWKEVAKYSFIEEFTMLRNTRQDISHNPWAEPAIRMLMKKARCVKNAKTEIVRCSVEVRRVHTAIVDETRHFRSILTRLRDENSQILGPVKAFCLRRTQINRHIMTYIYNIYNIPEFSGHHMPGIRLGAMQVDPPQETDDVRAEMADLTLNPVEDAPDRDVSPSTADDIEMDDAAHIEVVHLAEFMSQLSLK